MKFLNIERGNIMERIKRVYGWNGTGYTSIKVLRALNYHGKVRVWNIGK